MLKAKIILLSWLLACSLGAFEPFPETDSIKASIAGSFLKLPKENEFSDFKIYPSSHPRKADALNIRYYPANSEHLVFMLSGIGEYEKAKVANNLASPLVQAGYDVVVLPSVFTQMFAQSFSRTGYVGFLPADAKDMLHAFEMVVQILEKEQRATKFKQFSLFGYSLGALTAAHILAENDRSAFSFERVVLINPPLDLFHGLKFLDDSSEQGRKPTLWNTLFGRYTPLRDITLHNKTIEQITQEDFITYVEKLEQVAPNDLQGLIGHLLKTSLSGVVLASQRAYDLDLLNEFQKGSFDFTELWRRRNARAKKVSFEEYALHFLAQYYQRILGRSDFTLDKMNRLSSLYGLEKVLKNQPNFFLIHNQDDFLLKNEDRDYLRRTYGERLLFFPRGGHLGNLWHPPTLEAIFEFIQWPRV